MIVKAIKTKIILPRKQSLERILNESIMDLQDGVVVAVSSKIVAICEGRVVPIGSVDKQKLVEKESDQYIPANLSKYDFSFTLLHDTLIPIAGIDESNGGGNYILWPKDPRQSANEIRRHLKNRFNLERIGVIVIDSTAYPLRYGTVNIVIGHSGFLAAKDYRGKPDLFGRPFKVSISSIAGGLAAAAGLIMGEGTEQTPIVVMEDLPFVQFQSRNPTKKELDDFYIPIVKDDLFAPFLNTVKWQEGGKKNNGTA